MNIKTAAIMITRNQLTGIRTLSLTFLALLLLNILGCTMVGQPIPAQKRIALEASQDSTGTFTKDTLTISYQYNWSGEQLQIAGDIKLQWGVNFIDIYAVFLDHQGIILEQKIVYSSGYKTSTYRREERRFEKTLSPPKGTEAFSFTYSSQERSGRR